MNRRRLILFGGIAIALCVLLARPAHWFYQQFIYAQERRRAADVVESLVGRRPRDTNSKEWEVASGWAVTAYHNVCFSPSHVELEELRRFRADLEAKYSSQADIDMATIDWIWRRLAETGPHGKQYVARFEPEYRQQLDAVRDSSPSTTNER